MLAYVGLCGLMWPSVGLGAAMLAEVGLCEHWWASVSPCMILGPRMVVGTSNIFHYSKAFALLQRVKPLELRL